MSENAQASNCVKCGSCEKKCPQHIRIREKLEEVVNTLEK
ncbi:4Fe-4S dicluster domain-containing protein [Romboutsia ilealis]|nr:4Fe-4S binding protein [Romboutsia ilealis]